MKSHKSAIKTKKSLLYSCLRAFQARKLHELLLVPIPSAAPEWVRKLWQHLCPNTSTEWPDPTTSVAVRSTFVSMVEAGFIALRRSFRKHPPCEAVADKTFGTPAKRMGLNSTPGTESNAARVEGLLAYCMHYRPAVDVLRSRLINEVAGEAGAPPQPALRLHAKPSGGSSCRWKLGGMQNYVILSNDDAELFGLVKGHHRWYRMEFRIESEADFIAVHQLTFEEAASIRGTKISFKIWKVDTALGGWWPLRSRKATHEIMFLYKRATDAVRFCGAAPELPHEEITEDMPPQHEDLAGCGRSARLLQ